MLLRAEKGGAKMPDRDQNRNAHEGLRLAALTTHTHQPLPTSPKGALQHKQLVAGPSPLGLDRLTTFSPRHRGTVL